jgi:hypothetical protein
MDPHPHGEAELLLLLQAPLQWPERFDEAQPRAHGALRVVFVRLRMPKIDQQPVAEILGEVPLKALDHCRTDHMIGPDHLAVRLGIEAHRQRRRVDHITKQHRQLAALGLRYTRCG